MIISYIFMFLMLLTLFKQLTFKEIQNFQVHKYFYEFYYDTHVHRRSSLNAQGFSLRELVENNSQTCDLFKNFIPSVYSETSGYYQGVEYDLLDFFQSQITFNQKNADDNDRFYISTIRDLSKKKILDNLPEPLKAFYKNIVQKNGSSPYLLQYFNSKDLKQKTVINLYYAPEEVLEALFGEENKNYIFAAIKRYKKSKETPLDSEEFFKALMSSPTLFHHPNRDKVSFLPPK